MKKICLLILLCAGVALSMMAGMAPTADRKHPSREMIGRAVQGHLPNAATKAPSSLQRVMLDRGLTPDDNPLTKKAPRRLSVDDMSGIRLASLKCLDYDENFVLSDTPFYLGWKTNFGSVEYDSVNTYLEIDSIYGDYNMYVDLDIDAAEAVLYYGAISSTSSSNISGAYRYDTTTVAYVLDWAEFVEGDVVDMNTGRIYSDGSIVFDGNFLFMFDEVTTKTNIITHQVTRDTTCVVSPVISNLSLFVPNGIHEFDVFVRPHSVITDSSLLDSLYSVQIASGWGYVGGLGGTADINGVIGRKIDPRKPGNPGSSGNVRLMMPTSEVLGNEQDAEPERITHNPVFNNEHSEPVYMYQLNGTTVGVYNLYGTGVIENYLKICEDGTMFFPSQVIGHGGGAESIIYNCSDNTQTQKLELGSWGLYSSDTIQWDNTIPVDISVGPEGSGKVYENNKLYFTDGATFTYQETVPENLTAIPGALSANVAWEDSVNTAWNVRWRPRADLLSGSVFFDFNGTEEEVEGDCSGWLTIDADGDGYEWSVAVAGLVGLYSHDCCWNSFSWDLRTGPLVPDNWLISPKVNLQGVLKFSIWGELDSYPDSIMPYVCIGNPESIDDFVALADRDFFTTSTKTEYIIDLSAYEGKQGHIAFRHYNSIDQYYVNLDDIFIGYPEGNVIEPVPWNYVYGLEDAHCTIEGLTPETTYEVQVQGLNTATDATSWTDLVLFTTDEYQIAYGDVNKDGKVTIKDVTALIDVLLGGNPLDETDTYSPDNANVNGDDDITIKDVTALIDMLLSGENK